MNSFRLHDPIWLFGLILAAAVVWYSQYRRRQNAVLFSDLTILLSLPRTAMQRMKNTLPYLRFLGLSLLIIALARPQEGKEEFRVHTQGIAIEMAIDRSGSMEALDFEEQGERVNRLQVVKRVFKDFVVGSKGLTGRPGDQIGIIQFGGFAESACPLTLDHGAVLQVLEQIEIPQPIQNTYGDVINKNLLEEERATAIGDAIALGVDRLKDSSIKSKILILLSDGENTAGLIDPLEAAKLAKEFQIKIYTIGVGTNGRVPFYTQDIFGKKMLVSNYVKLDEKALRAIAEITGGKYFNARDTQALEEVYRTIDQLEKTEIEGQIYTQYKEQYLWPLLAGLTLLLLDIILGASWLRGIP